jgi:type I restriction-modification system DNA methylase subunit
MSLKRLLRTGFTWEIKELSMLVPDKMLQLVERFDHNFEAYTHAHYNEAQTRQEFIDPLFKSLGWDMDNEQGYAEAYKDVVHEDAIKVGRATKAPDYSFRIGGARKFFVEAKKPAVNIKDDPSPAYQLRRYAWSAKLPLSIVTDFEEFAVYDCRVKPEKSDNASKARVLYLTYREYPQQWDTLVETFSKEAILKGSFDKYAESNKAKKGTAEVDVAFLHEIERWRELLARNIALRNPRLTRRELNFAVQRTIDRLIFLRICEDRGIENYGKLMALQNGTQVYQRLLHLFYQADDRYNSGIFHFKTEKERMESPDALTPELKIDDAVLKDILKNLYYPDSPYEFSVLPADILGQVYEQFLGKVIRLTAGHQAKVEEKPEVKKAGGVYYTPTYIVEYIVKQTVGELLKEKSPKQAEKLTILDPACGSGSFLLGAYQYLLDWYRDAYLNDDPQKWSKGRQPRLYHSDRGEWKLTIEERKRILLHNIYGVDIDSQAVEVTKLSLLLKVLEGEDEQTLTSQMSLFHKRVLPDLSNNIKCGNSLIGSDFYEGQQLLLLDEEEMYRINPFDWEKEFPDIMQKGGFDAVIGNPPYVLIGSDRPMEQSYYIKNYVLTVYKTNTYMLFLEKGLKILGKLGSMLGYIIPKSLVFNTYFSKARSELMKTYAIPYLIEIEDKVFQNAEVGDSLLFFAKIASNPEQNILTYFRAKNIYPQFEVIEKFENQQEDLLKQNESLFYLSNVLIKAFTMKLDEPLSVSNGLNPGNVRHILFSDTKKSEKHQKLVLGRDIQRYELSWSGTWVNYDPELKSKITLKDVKSKEGMTAQKKVDFALRDPKIFTPNKILVRKTSDKIIACLDLYGYYFDSLAYSIQLLPNTRESIYYFLGLLNSKLLGYIHDGYSMNKNKVFAKVLATNLKKLPIRPINFDNQKDNANHDKMVELVERMLDLHKQLHAAKLPQAQTLLQRQINAADRQIDRLVYDLYGLTEEEIKIVEGI